MITYVYLKSKEGMQKFIYYTLTHSGKQLWI